MKKVWNLRYGFTQVKEISRERADCTVLATGYALALTYKEAHDLMAKLGRKPRCRFDYRVAAKAMNLHERLDFAERQLGEILDDMQVGRYVVRVRGRVFAVVNGRIHDNRFADLNIRVKQVFQVSLTKPALLLPYPYLNKITQLEALPDMRGVCSRERTV